MRQMSKTKTILKVNDYFSQNIGPFFMIHIYTNYCKLEIKPCGLGSRIRNMEASGMEAKSYN